MTPPEVAGWVNPIPLLNRNSLTEKTGGSFVANFVPPEDTGGTAISGYRLYMAVKPGNGKWEKSNDPTIGSNAQWHLVMDTLDPTNDALPPNKLMTPTSAKIGYLKKNTHLLKQKTYGLRVQALNAMSDCTVDGWDRMSNVYEVTTNSASQPSIPRNLRLNQAKVTGGALAIEWDPPLDSGGQSVDDYYVEMFALFNLTTVDLITYAERSQVDMAAKTLEELISDKNGDGSPNHIEEFRGNKHFLTPMVQQEGEHPKDPDQWPNSRFYNKGNQKKGYIKGQYRSQSFETSPGLSYEKK
jgi:hypothetical protein